MIHLPIARREMLVMAKSAALYRGRIGNSISLLFLGVVFAIVYHFAGLRAIGPLIHSVAGILIIICLFVGVQLTADSIAHEKREGTLGLLFLTPLTSFQIVLGKLIAHSLSGFYWLLIATPLLSLMLIVGGIRGRDFAAIAVAALNTLFFSAAVGLFVSTRHSERKKAATAGTWVILFFWLGVPGLAFLAAQLEAPIWVTRALEVAAINGGFSVATGPVPPSLGSPWMNLLWNHLMGWGFVGLATLSLRRNWQEVPPRKRFSLREWWKERSLGKPATRLRLRHTLLNRNPFLWLASRDRFRIVPLWVITTVLLAIMGLFIAYSGMPSAVMVLVLTVAMSMVHRGAAAGLSAQQLQAEHEQGTLEMITSTPLSVENIIRGQMMATRRQLFGPALLVVLLHLLAIVLLFFWAEAHDIDPPVLFGIFAHIFSYFLDLYALTWAGMWGATIVRDPKNAAGAAMLRIVMLPVLAVMILMAAGSVAKFYGLMSFEVSFIGILALWFTIAVANNVSWVIFIRRRLPAQLRAFAVKRYSPDERLGLFGKLGRLFGSLIRPKQPPIIRPISGGP